MLYATRLRQTFATAEPIIKIGDGTSKAWFGRLANLYIEGNKGGGATGHGIHLDGATQGSIRHVYVNKAGNVGIYGDGTYYFEISDCRVFNSVSHGLHFISTITTVGELSIFQTISQVNGGSGIYLQNIGDLALFRFSGIGNTEYGIMGGGRVGAYQCHFEANKKDQANLGFLGEFSACRFMYAPAGYYGVRVYRLTADLTLSSPIFDGNAAGAIILGTNARLILQNPSPINPTISLGAGTIVYAHGPAYRNSGTATIPDTTTSIVVPHGCSYTPTIGHISVMRTNLGGASTKFWVDPASIGPVNFTITVDVDPGAPTATFKWDVQRTP